MRRIGPLAASMTRAKATDAASLPLRRQGPRFVAR
jgi:hypothetical protein